PRYRLRAWHLGTPQAGSGSCTRTTSGMSSEDTPLSFAQQRLWFLDQLLPGTPLYNVPLVLDLEGPVVAGALERALREIVRRHEPLRTVFPSTGGSPRQAVVPHEAFALAVDEMATGKAVEDEVRLEHRIFEEVRRPFDLAAGPVFRASLVRLSP